MTTRVRFEHTYLKAAGLHRITSPDIKGFCITADTYDQAERETMAMLSLINGQGLLHAPGRLAAVDFELA